ncbi:MAG: hypothetical protein WBA59_03915 [Moheibacter sp.]
MAKKIYYIPEGIPNLKPLFPGLDLDSVEEWSVIIKNKSGNTIAQTGRNVMGCCCNENDKVRMYFVNDIGEIDSLNLTKIQKTDDVKSSSWKKSKPFPFDATSGGAYRSNISDVEVFESETICYGERDQEWISELMRTPLAWIEVPDRSDSSDGIYPKKNMMPVLIKDTKFVKRKNKDRYQYVVKVEFSMSNEANTKR